jgi:hypothetical protein
VPGAELPAAEAGKIGVKVDADGRRRSTPAREPLGLVQIVVGLWLM